MQRAIWVASLLLSASIMPISLFVTRLSFAGQGKGGEVVAKPTPNAKPKTPGVPSRTNTPRPRRKTSSSFHPQNPHIELIRIPGGSFMMGSTSGNADERPVHLVTISYSFYVGKYEVTQTQWQAVMGNNPSNFSDCGNCPIEQVSWDDAQSFIHKLNQMNDGYIYRLPTEAEWEFACRAGTRADYAGSLSEIAWYNQNSGNRTHPVGSRGPNDWGLYDMHGNVWEWCEDWYHDTYSGAPTDGSAWLSGGVQKRPVMRGGSWSVIAANLRSAYRDREWPNAHYNSVGFRVVAVARTS